MSPLESSMAQSLVKVTPCDMDCLQPVNLQLSKAELVSHKLNSGVGGWLWICSRNILLLSPGRERARTSRLNAKEPNLRSTPEEREESKRRAGLELVGWARLGVEAGEDRGRNRKQNYVGADICSERQHAEVGSRSCGTWDLDIKKETWRVRESEVRANTGKKRWVMSGGGNHWFKPTIYKVTWKFWRQMNKRVLSCHK